MSDIVICVSKKMMEWTPNNIVKGSSLSLCHNCKCEIYICLTTQKLISENLNALTYCVDCAMKHVEKLEDKGAKVNYTTVPGAIKEAKKHLKENPTPCCEKNNRILVP
jgi:hypothetical protein